MCGVSSGRWGCPLSTLGWPGLGGPSDWKASGVTKRQLGGGCSWRAVGGFLQPWPCPRCPLYLPDGNPAAQRTLVWSGPLLRRAGRASRTLSCWLVVPAVWLQTSALSTRWAHLPLWAECPDAPRPPLAQALAALPPPSSVSIGSWSPVPPAGFGGQSSPWKTASLPSSLPMS